MSESENRGRIVREYDDYAVWLSPFSEGKEVEMGRDTYTVYLAHEIPVATYEQAIAQPEWEVFR